MSEKKLSGKTEIAFKILVYSHAIEMLFTEGGLCYAIRMSLYNYCGFPFTKSETMAYHQMSEHFPEIYKYKPSGVMFTTWFLLTRKGLEIRKKILQDEIEKLFDKL